MLNSNSESRYLCSFSDLKRKDFSLLPLSIMLSVGFLSMPLLMVRKFGSIPSFLSVFIMKGFDFFQMPFLGIIVNILNFSVYLDYILYNFV